MARQQRFLVVSSFLGIAAFVAFLILLGAQPTSASTPIGQGVPAYGDRPLEQAGNVDRGDYLVEAGACAGCHGARNLAKQKAHTMCQICDDALPCTGGDVPPLQDSV